MLGPARVLWLEPRVGVRAAELLEMPVMLAVIVLAARHVNRRFAGHDAVRTGLVALGLLLGAEVGLGVALTGQTVEQVLFGRDPVSGTAYYLALAAFAAMPWLLGTRLLTIGAPGWRGGGGGPSAGGR